MERCKNCGAMLYDDDDKCDFCGNYKGGQQKYNAESYNEERFEENFNEYHETIDCNCEKPKTSYGVFEEQQESILDLEGVCPNCGNGELDERGTCDICNYGTTYCSKCESFSSGCEDFCPDCGTQTVPGPEYTKFSPVGTCVYCGVEPVYDSRDACNSCKEKMEKAQSVDLCGDCIKDLGGNISEARLHNAFLTFGRSLHCVRYSLCSLFFLSFFCGIFRGYFSFIPVGIIIIFFNINFVKNMSFKIKCFRCGKKKVSEKKVVINILACIIRIAIPLLIWFGFYSSGYVRL